MSESYMFGKELFNTTFNKSPFLWTLNPTDQMCLVFLQRFETLKVSWLVHEDKVVFCSAVQ